MNDVFTNVSTNDLQDINGALSYCMFSQQERCPPDTSCKSCDQTVLNVGMNI